MRGSRDGLPKPSKVGPLDSRGQAKPCFQLAVSWSVYRNVDRDADRLAPGSNSSLHHFFREAAVGLDIELEPDRTLRRRSNLFDRKVGEGCSTECGFSHIRAF